MLAMMISIVWVSISFEEMQSCVVFLAALFEIPRSRHTHIEVLDARSYLRSMPFMRYVFMTLITLLRLTTSAWVMGLGLRWILKEKRITGILHSAIDFCFVQDIGKLIAPSFTSILVHTIVSSLVPLSHIFYTNRTLGILLQVLTLCTGALLIVLAWGYYLAFDIEHMHELQTALCSGNLDFHSAWQESTGYVLSASTATQKKTSGIRKAFERKINATRELIGLDTAKLQKNADPIKNVRFSRYFPKWSVFRRALNRPANFVDDVISCDDVCPKNKVHNQFAFSEYAEARLWATRRCHVRRL